MPAGVVRDVDGDGADVPELVNFDSDDSEDDDGDSDDDDDGEFAFLPASTGAPAARERDMVAYEAVTEAQARGALHHHFLLSSEDDDGDSDVGITSASVDIDKLQLWLESLRDLGHPLYQDIEIPGRTELASQLESISQQAAAVGPRVALLSRL